MKTIIITGSPGTGKTTLSKIIAKKINAELISLNELVISKNFIENYDKERDTYVADFAKLKKFVLTQIEKAKKQHIENIIIEGHFADIIPNKYIEKVIILRTHPDILKERLKKRGYKENKIKENIQAEILGNCTNYILQKELTCPIYELDTSITSISQTSKLIIKMIKNKNISDSYDVGNLDWLEQLSSKDRLNEFFD
jgi:adenylate kinase